MVITTLMDFITITIYLFKIMKGTIVMKKQLTQLHSLVFDAGGPFLYLILVGIPFFLVVLVISVIIVVVLLIKNAHDKKKNQDKPETPSQ